MLNQVQTEYQAIQNELLRRQLEYQKSLDSISMIRAEPQSVLRRYFNTPEYRAMFGTTGAAVDPNATMVQRFQFDPGYQFQQNEAARQLQQNAAARGVLNSGRTLAALQDQSQNMANQSYNQFQNRWLEGWRNYQNMLGGIASQGQAQANQSSQNLLGTGNNLSSLYNNTGTTLANANVAMGTGMANNIMQGAMAQAQMDAASSAAGASGFGSIMGLAGKMIGMKGGLF